MKTAGLGFREIAVALHISVHTAHNAYETGMKKLRARPNAIAALQAIADLKSASRRQVGNDLARQYTSLISNRDSNSRWDEADVSVTAVVRERVYTEMSEVAE